MAQTERFRPVCAIKIGGLTKVIRQNVPLQGNTMAMNAITKPIVLYYCTT
jgi:hypothetical protein